MNTFKKFNQGLKEIPLATTWLLNDIAEMKGRQKLYTNQSPHTLKVLKEHAIIESSVSSNRIEGVEIDNKRIGTVIFGRQHLKDRNEEEIRGYREVLNLIHSEAEKLKLSTDLILKMHKIMRGDIWDAGQIKDRNSDIIETFPNGEQRVRFKTVSVEKTLEYLNNLIFDYNSSILDRKIPDLIGLASFNLDFLCIHPFRDGNGRISRLLLLEELYRFGIEAGRFVSLEKIIEETKEQYYETLEISSKGWHESNHDPWPYINYVLFILKELYKSFESKFINLKSAKGTKTDSVIKAIKSFNKSFSIRELEFKCPGISREMLRKVLKDLKKDNIVSCEGRGIVAVWKIIE
ncbi:MAG TPA: Fic family protein [Lentisphaeria bacterium]|nr:MAG: cell filamentation protein Fic [Lentisphaerae bacterium GWF2_38_69]HBM14755.1 Fic family protein [Lentisphaeria bacterium]